ncbi:cold-shock protein [Actinocorallia lasiicapitis]
MPSGKVKWYDTEKGFGFLTRDDGGEVFVHSSALPEGVTSLKQGQRVEFGVAEGRRGQQALQVKVIDTPPSVERTLAKAKRKKPDDLAEMTEDLIKLLDHVGDIYKRGKYPSSAEAKKIATVLRAVADDIEL